MTAVTKADCDKRTARVWKGIGLLLVVMGLFVGIAGWSLSAGRAAQNDAAKVATEIKTHAAAQTEREKGIEKRLERLQTDVTRINTKLDAIWKEKHGFSGGD